MTEEVARQLGAGARLDGDARRRSRLAALDRVAAAQARDRGADHRATGARGHAGHRAAAAAASPWSRRRAARSQGVEAVIDKDRAVGAARDRDERRPADDPDRRRARRDPLRHSRTSSWLDRITVADAERYAGEGHFGAAAWGRRSRPSSASSTRRPGARGVITNAESIARALRGETGTWIDG